MVGTGGHTRANEPALNDKITYIRRDPDQIARVDSKSLGVAEMKPEDFD
jgi:hypothetical protein